MNREDDDGRESASANMRVFRFGIIQTTNIEDGKLRIRNFINNSFVFDSFRSIFFFFTSFSNGFCAEAENMGIFSRYPATMGHTPYVICIHVYCDVGIEWNRQ